MATDRAVSQGINNCAVFLNAIPDAMIAPWSPEKRKVVHDFLTKQAARFV